MGSRGVLVVAVLAVFGCAGKQQPKKPSRPAVPVDFTGEDHYRKAVVAYKKVLELRKELKKAKTVPERRRLEGLLEFQWEVYRKHLAKAEKALPEDLRVAMLRGAYWFLKGRYGKALSVYDGILRVKETLATAHYMRARCLLELGRLREARKACERSLELAPEYRLAAVLLVEIDRRIAASQR